MVVGVLAPVLGLALALPTGLLFGLGYGTGVRVGYEQLYPLLFPAKDVPRTPEQVKQTLMDMNNIYNAIGGKEASQMGMGMGVQAAGDLLKDPDFPVLEELESRLSGRTPGKSDTRGTSDQDFLDDKFQSQMYSFEWIQDFIQRITTAPRFQLIIWRAFLESNPTNKLSPGDIATLIILVTEALHTDSEDENGDVVTDAYRAAFRQLLLDLPVEDLYSMYQFRGQYPVWQRQMIVEAFREIDEATYQTDYQQRRIEYQRQRDLLLKNLNDRRQIERDDKARNYNNASSQIRHNLFEAQQKALEHLLRNFIQLSRNDLTLKSLANPDWNKRIWTIDRIPT